MPTRTPVGQHRHVNSQVVLVPEYPILFSAILGYFVTIATTVQLPRAPVYFGICADKPTSALGAHLQGLQTDPMGV